MTIVLDVSFNDHPQQTTSSNDDSQKSAINEISSKKVRDKRNSSPSKANKVAKVKNKVSVHHSYKIINPTHAFITADNCSRETHHPLTHITFKFTLAFYLLRQDHQRIMQIFVYRVAILKSNLYIHH